MTTTQTTHNSIRSVLKFGQSIWYDGLIAPEEFARLINEDGLRGATTNPAIFEKALASGAYDDRIRAGKASGDAETIYRTLAVEEVQKIADVFLPVYEETKGRDGYVSIEVSPRLADDFEKTVCEAREIYLHAARPNVMIKVPATVAGTDATEVLIREGINVNVTLIFSQRQYARVMEAYLRGLEARAKKGLAIDRIGSVASFFVSRVDTAVDGILEEKIAGGCDLTRRSLESLLGCAAIANSKVAYAAYENIFHSKRFDALSKLGGAMTQRPLWASTGTKNPKYRDVIYIETLVGPDTVNTVPPPTLDAFRDHGVVVPTLQEGMAEARGVLDQLGRLGIDLDAVTEDLQKKGVKLFVEAYDKIIHIIEEKLK